MNFWDQYTNYFEPEEFADPLHPGSGEYADKDTVLCLDDLRGLAGCKIVTMASVGGAVDVDGVHGHAENSYHLWKNGAKAIDFYIPGTMDVRDQVRLMLRSDFTGIGMYYNMWKDHKGIMLPVAFHGDVRPVKKFQVWTCREHGEYVYLI